MHMAAARRALGSSVWGQPSPNNCASIPAATCCWPDRCRLRSVAPEPRGCLCLVGAGLAEARETILSHTASHGRGRDAQASRPGRWLARMHVCTALRDDHYICSVARILSDLLSVGLDGYTRAL